MSCNSNFYNGCCDPCVPATQTQESVASILNNLILTIFGPITQTVVNGQIVWNTPCDPTTNDIPCFPRMDGEGFICYLLRLMNELAIFPMGDWDSLVDYCKGNLVKYQNALYIALDAVPAGTLPTDITYWFLAVEPIVGPPGPQGPPGPAGPPNQPVFAARVLTVSDTLTNTDELIWCEPAAGIITVTLPLQGSVDPSKYYYIWTDGAFTVTIDPSGAETVNGAATYSLTLANEAILLASRNNGDWRIL